jgi:uncharacterized protein DUF3435
MLDALPTDPEIANLQRRRNRFKMKIQTKYMYITWAKGTATEKEYQRILASIDCAEKKCRRAVQEEYRRDYFHRRHTKEIERQWCNGGVRRARRPAPAKGEDTTAEDYLRLPRTPSCNAESTLSTT